MERKVIKRIFEGVSIDENIALIKKLHPATKRIVMITDKTSFGNAMTELAGESILEGVMAHYLS